MSGSRGIPDALAAVLPLGHDRTVEQALARELRTAIVDGRLAPGTRLPYRELAEQFNVSVTPIRIVLRELVHEGLVEMRPQGGARVTPLSAGELEDIYATRTGLEGWLAHQGAGRLGDAGVSAMGQSLTAVEAAAAANDRDAYLQSVWVLRGVCYRAADRPHLLVSVERLYARSTRYNWMTLRDEARLRESLADVRAFQAACRDRDGVRARTLIREALDQTMNDLIGRLANELGVATTR